MKGPIYSTPPVLSKNSNSGVSFICDNPEAHMGPKPAIPNPRDSSVQCGTQVQLNYFNINASSVALKSRPPSGRSVSALKQHHLNGQEAVGQRSLRPRTAPARRKQTGQDGNSSVMSVKSSTSMMSQPIDVQRAPLVPTLVSFDAHGPAQLKSFQV